MGKRHTQTCPVAGFLNIFGDSWTLMIVREAFYGATRFSEFQRNTGIAKNLLSDRLSMLVEEDILQIENIGERGTRYAYRFT
ncbi:MAG: helix-turn-helix domain-containing protein, partial [Myxococcota bacterium]